MKRWMKWTVGTLAALVAIVAILAGTGWQLAQRKMVRTVDVAVAPVAYATGPDALQRGKYLYESRGCADCHGADAGGHIFVNEANGLRLGGPDITAAGATRNYQPQDWVRTIRHGVKPAGQPLMIMPSEDYNRFTDADLAALVAYVRALPPANGAPAVLELPMPVRVMYGLGAIRDAADKIDHARAPAQAVPVGIDARHGAYVANMCIGCHGEHLSGGRIPGGPPDWPPAANLTAGDGSVMARYPDATAFMTMLRSGKRPDGSAIKVMPFESLGKLNDVDAQAVYEFLKTVPARAAGGR